MPSRFAVNETEAYLQCGLEGLGLIQLSEFVASPYLETGRLKEVLASARSASVPISIVYPNGRKCGRRDQGFCRLDHPDLSAKRRQSGSRIEMT